MIYLIRLVPAWSTSAITRTFGTPMVIFVDPVWPATWPPGLWHLSQRCGRRPRRPSSRLDQVRLREYGQVQCGVEVPVEAGAAGLAQELPLGEDEFGSHTAPHAEQVVLEGIPPVGHHTAHPGVGGLVLDLAPELGHPETGEVPGQAAVADYPGQVQVLATMTSCSRTRRVVSL
jgi:hypothetical protein